jgi:hypothetical protein
MSLFSSKMKDRNINQVLSGECTGGRGEDIRKGCGRMNMVKILYTHV